MLLLGGVGAVAHVLDVELFSLELLLLVLDHLEDVIDVVQGDLVVVDVVCADFLDGGRGDGGRGGAD